MPATRRTTAIMRSQLIGVFACVAPTLPAHRIDDGHNAGELARREISIKPNCPAARNPCSAETLTTCATALLRRGLFSCAADACLPALMQKCHSDCLSASGTAAAGAGALNSESLTQIPNCAPAASPQPRGRGFPFLRPNLRHPRLQVGTGGF